MSIFAYVLIGIILYIIFTNKSCKRNIYKYYGNIYIHIYAYRSRIFY